MSQSKNLRIPFSVCIEANRKKLAKEFYYLCILKLNTNNGNFCDFKTAQEHLVSNLGISSRTAHDALNRLKSINWIGENNSIYLRSFDSLAYYLGLDHKGNYAFHLEDAVSYSEFKALLLASFVTKRKKYLKYLKIEGKALPVANYETHGNSSRKSNLSFVPLSKSFISRGIGVSESDVSRSKKTAVKLGYLYENKEDSLHKIKTIRINPNLSEFDGWNQARANLKQYTNAWGMPDMIIQRSKTGKSASIYQQGCSLLISYVTISKLRNRKKWTQVINMYKVA